jgi:hypothetical protein
MATAKTQVEGGIVEVRMINPKRTGTVTLRDYNDPITGEFREFKDAHGNPRVKKYTKALTILRLNNENDRLEYEHLKNHPLYVNGSEAILKIVDVTQEAEERTSKRESALEALIEAKGLRGEKLYNFARVLGVQTLNQLESIVKDKVYDIAEKTPEEFLKAFNDPNRTFKETLHKGKIKGVFTVSNNIWKFRDVLMGANIDEAILWLKENDDLMPSIRKELSSVKN